MIAKLTDEHYSRILHELEGLGLSYDPLKDDLADHVCCLMEDAMEEGRNFDAAFRELKEELGDKTISGIQHQTLLNLDKKYQQMKNLTYIFGLSGGILTLVGAIFKKMHWPLAGILITLGIFLVVAIFLPMYFVGMNREQQEKKNPIYSIVGYLTIALLLVGALFKIQHWPGANIALMAGLAMVMIGFIPLYVVNIFQKTGTTKIGLPYVAMLLVGISIVMVMANVNMGKYLIDIYQDEALVNEVQVERAQERTAKLMDSYFDSLDHAVQEKAAEIHQAAAALQLQILDMQTAMKAGLGQEGSSLEDIKGKDDRAVGRDAILDSGRGADFGEASMAYRALLEGILDDPVAIIQVQDHLDYTSEYWPHEFGPEHIGSAPFIKTYFKLSDAARGVALAEYVAISNLLHQ